MANRSAFVRFDSIRSRVLLVLYISDATGSRVDERISQIDRKATRKGFLKSIAKKKKKYRIFAIIFKRRYIVTNIRIFHNSSRES